MHAIQPSEEDWERRGISVMPTVNKGRRRREEGSVFEGRRCKSDLGMEESIDRLYTT